MRRSRTQTKVSSKVSLTVQVRYLCHVDVEDYSESLLTTPVRLWVSQLIGTRNR